MPARTELLRLLTGLVLAWALAPALRAEVPAALARPLAELGVPLDAVGLVIAPAAGGARFVEHQPNLPLQPGSTMKLVTTLVGLEQLGPGWRGRTRLLAAGPIRDGVLYGDLVLQGQGDIDLGWPAVHALLQHARNRGLVDIRGALVLDRHWTRPARFDLGVPPFDESPEFEYNVIADALLVGGNLLRIELFADDQRGLQVVPTTALAGVRVTHEMQLVDGDCSAWEDLWKPPEVRPAKPGRTLDVVLRGAWPLRCDRAVEINVIERNDYIARGVRAAWSSLGGRWRGGVREGRAPADAALLAERWSRPLSELVRAINKPSDNAATRMLLLAIGQAAPGASDEPTLLKAERAVRGWLKGKGIADDGVVIDNGSGLSRSERLSAAQLEAVVRAGLASRWAPEFAASLPIVGIDGTMRRRLTDSPAAGTARLKTGTLRNTVALAGTMTDAAGRPLVVAVMVNHDQVKPRPVRQALDALIDWIARTRFAGAEGVKP